MDISQITIHFYAKDGVKYAVVGVIAPDTDPYVQKVVIPEDREDTVRCVLSQISDVVTEAQRRWSETPKNPAYTPPKVTTPTPAAPAAGNRGRQTPGNRGQAANTEGTQQTLL